MSFRLSWIKKAAKAAYQKHLEGKAFVPSVFKEENHIDEIVGIYVPFWLFDMETNALVTYDAERSRVWMSGDVEYTEHEFFKIERGGTMAFEHIPEDGSRKMEDDLMESLEPYDFKDAVPFKDPYLAGYVAERYDVEADECKKRAKTCKGKHKAGTSGHSERLFDRKTGFRQCEDPKGISEICTVSGVDIKYNLAGSKVCICHERTDGKDGRRSAGR